MFNLNPGPDVIAASWQEAIEDWRAGDITTMDRWLRSGREMPEFVRTFLADVLAGKEVRPRKRPPVPRYRSLADSGVMRDALIRMDYDWFYMIFQAAASTGKKRGEKSPKEKALEAVSKKWGFKVKPGTVSHIVHKRRGR
ncbi:MAG TPA: hypothetical protein VMV78_07815 [Thiobacillus sp.]|nr:hypothetical protein [Thiobacillus sp.]